MTGLVGVMEITKQTDTSLTTSELQEVKDILTNAYDGVNESDIQLDVVYTTTGVIEIDTEDVTEEVLTTLQNALATSLDIHPKNVELEVIDGEINYTISTDTAEDTDAIQIIMDRSVFTPYLNK